ncbi:MAG: Eco57I restriction-modification methylase domain-containing protein [Nannocystales bacterium]
MARDVERQFHETWLGESQPLEGLTFSVPVLCDGGVMNRLSVGRASVFVEHVGREDGAAVADVLALMREVWEWADEELETGESLPDDLVLRIAEEGTELRPLAAVRYGVSSEPEPETEAAEAATAETVAGEQTPAIRAGAEYQMLIWEVPQGLELDRAESETTQWHYPPAAKFERLLRETRVPIGLLSNGTTLRLFYCPAGAATGWISFPVGYMATPAGRDMLSAVQMLLGPERVLGGMPGTPTTLELLEGSRERQADVTTQLGAQLVEGLQILLEGFEVAERRDNFGTLRYALEQEGNHVYEGLLTVMLRLVFALAAEDRGLVPSEHSLYAAHLSVGGLYDELAADADVYADTMEQRFGAWSRLVVLFRALYFGVEQGSLRMPPHRGRLFNPEAYAFLEGPPTDGVAVALSGEQRSAQRVPSVSDGVVYRVLRRLLYLDGQRLSYSALAEEQLGGVYESMMGFEVERRAAPSVCLRPARVWVSPHEVLDLPKATRQRWLKDEGVATAAAKRIVKGLDAAVKEHEDGEPLLEAAMEVLRAESVAGKRDSAVDSGAEVAAGRLVIQPGQERRRTSSHYTPVSLSGPIVARTLEPLLAAMRAKAKEEDPGLEDPQPSAEALLSLKVCDPAMGSGAFLVEACRFLAKQVHAAWVREGTLAKMLREAEAGGGDDVVVRDPQRLAQRMVAQQCLYGVDKNPLAVELGKLSLWLLTLSKGQTFAFLDHCLKAGDSLVGLDKAQMLAMDWERPKATPAKKKRGKKAKAPEKQVEMFAEQTRRAFDKAAIARRKLAELSRRGDEGVTEAEQHRLYLDAERELERLRDVADVLVSAFFWPDDEKLVPEFLFVGKKPSDKARRGCLRRVRDQIEIWLQAGGRQPMPEELERRRALVREGIRPFHWHLEFPEVFDDARVDPLAVGVEGSAVWMDAVVGNPPFAGKNNITGANGPVYLDWLGGHYEPSHGNADLSAYFFRRAHWMLGEHGTLGLIATNTIGQGDTRSSGLQPMVAAGAKIYSATRSMKWPVRGAKVTVAVVHAAVGTAAHSGLSCSLDGHNAEAVNSRLRGKPERPDPVALRANAGKSFIGSYVLGKGFVLSPEQREELVVRDPRNAERIFPYLGGEELNSSPTHSHHRHVIDMGDMSLAEAHRWPELVELLRNKVKPERDKNKREIRRKYWWKFGEQAHGLYRAIAPLERCLACSLVSKHSVFSFLATEQVFSSKLAVFPFEDRASMGTLQSRVHSVWAWALSSTMRSDLNYSPSDCFETFPFPSEPTLASDAPLEAIATELYETRATFMVDTDQGLTKTYNALKDPENTDPRILHLRQLHEQLDRAVLDAYGQSHIEVPPYCGADSTTLERFEDEVLDFLFALNEQRAKEEASASSRA